MNTFVGGLILFLVINIFLVGLIDYISFFIELLTNKQYKGFKRLYFLMVIIPIAIVSIPILFLKILLLIIYLIVLYKIIEFEIEKLKGDGK